MESEKPIETKKVPRTSKKNYFRIEEDVKLLQYWNRKKDSMNMNDICNELSSCAGRSAEALRDRLKRYLVLLSQDDVRILINHSKVSSLHFHSFLILIFDFIKILDSMINSNYKKLLLILLKLKINNLLTLNLEIIWIFN